MTVGFSTPTDLEAKIAQLINVRIGSNMPPAKRVDDDYERLAALVADCPIGGLTLFNGVWPSTREVLERLQAACDIPLLVGSDIERGCGQQMHGLTVLPHAMAVDAAGGGDLETAERLAFEFGEVTAAEARLAGIHLAFAPVADTNTNPRNPIIATRAFGTDPHRVSRLVAAFVRGCESRDVAATAKHFPGHGDTEQDSHDSLPSVARDRTNLDAVELPAFRAAIDAGCSMLMTAHVAYPALDASCAPATLSRPILQDLLRDQLGFQGVVCSDSMLMAGVSERFESEGQLCQVALEAGVDWLLDVADPRGVVDYLANAVRAGRLDEQRIDQALDRVLTLKRRVCLPPADSQSAGEVLARSADLAQRIAAGAVRPVEVGQPAQLDTTRPLTVLLAKPFATPLDPPEQPLAAAIRTAYPNSTYFELPPDAPDSLVAAALQAALDSEQLLLAMIVKPAAWHKFGLLEYQSKLFAELAQRPGAVVVSLGVPTVLAEFPQASHRLCSYSDVPVSQQAVARALAESGRQVT